jgi:ketosteroid isomerase-like protein
VSNRWLVSFSSLILIALGACADGGAPAGPSAQLALSSAAAAEDHAPPNLNVVRANLLAAEQAYSEASSQSTILDFLPGLFDDAGTIITGGPPFPRGPAAIREVLALNPLNAASTLTWKAIRTDVSNDGSMGYTYGYWQTTIGGAPGAVGKYIAFWRRQTNGEWKLAAFKRVGRPAGTVSPEPPAGFRTPTYLHYRTFPQVDQAAEVESVKGADLAFAALAMSGVGEAFAAYVADDGANGGSGPEFSFGRDAVAGEFSTAQPGELRWAPEIADVAKSGDLGFTTGTAEVYLRNPDGSYTFQGIGRYLTVWKKQRTGEWRFVIDG